MASLDGTRPLFAEARINAILPGRRQLTHGGRVQRSHAVLTSGADEGQLYQVLLDVSAS